MAAVNITVAQAELVGQIAAVISVGVAVLLVWCAVSAFHALRDVLGGESSGGGLAAVERRAQRMQHLGEGQSDAYREMVSVDAYDAGYSGREFNPAWGQEQAAVHSRAQADRQADLAKGWK